MQIAPAHIWFCKLDSISFRPSLLGFALSLEQWLWLCLRSTPGTKLTRCPWYVDMVVMTTAYWCFLAFCVVCVFFKYTNHVEFMIFTGYVSKHFRVLDSHPGHTCCTVATTFSFAYFRPPVGFWLGGPCMHLCRVNQLVLRVLAGVQS